MFNPFSTFCDDFYVNMRLSTQLNLPHSRETVLHFFERIQKEFPTISRLRKQENGDISIEENRESDFYRWVTLESRRLLSGHVNPTTLEEAAAIHRLVLQLAPYDLGLSPVEVDHLDVLFGFDLTYRGNHDEIVAESMLAGSPLISLLDQPGARPVDVQPSVTIALSDDCRLQARIDVVTRTNSYQVRTGEYSNEVISVYLILRRYWGDRPREAMDVVYTSMMEKAEALCHSHVLPKILKPLSTTIASKS